MFHVKHYVKVKFSYIIFIFLSNNLNSRIMEKNIKYNVVNTKFNHVIYNGMPLSVVTPTLCISTLNFLDNVTKNVVGCLNNKVSTVWEFLQKITKEKPTNIDISLSEFLQIYICNSDVNTLFHFRFCNDKFIDMLYGLKLVTNFSQLDDLQRIAYCQAERIINEIDIMDIIFWYFLDLFEIPKEYKDYNNLQSKLRQKGSISIAPCDDFENYAMITLCENDHGSDLIFNFSDL